MKIAVVGSGIAGLASAWRLAQQAHEVTLFEADTRLGGHTDTHAVEVGGRGFAVDTGFIVHNRENYPLLCALFDELGVATQPTTMSFSVHEEATGLEYNAGTLDGLFCQRRNLASPSFLGMVRDLLRFYREAPALLATTEAGPSLGDYLAQRGYGRAFRDLHLVPMASALWSAPAATILEFPARYLAEFMAHHRMLQVAGRPQWRVVVGGSGTYIGALRARWAVRERAGCPVHALRRDALGVEVASAAGVERYDHVVLACHSDQALALLADADATERAVLGAIPYQANEVVLHTDASLLPRRRKAWAAWNAHVPRDPSAACTVSYCMNLLQGLDAPEPLVVTLNRGAAIDPARVLRTRHYAHPVYTQASVAARARKGEIQGRRRTWFAGAYWGWGFHEDGMRSAMDAVAGIAAFARGEAFATQVAA
jgi:predicted NAD/FAD-binding protein